MKKIVGALAIFLLSNICPAMAQESDQEKIKALIPAATALPDEEWRKVVTNATMPKVNHVCLTSVLLFDRQPPGKQDSDKDRRNEFQFVSGSADPALLAREVARGEYRTLVKSDRITSFTCEPGLEFYSGIVEFEVPDMYRGRFHYKAVEMDAGWTITEIALPACNILIKCNDEGQWERVDDSSISDGIDVDK